MFLQQKTRKYTLSSAFPAEITRNVRKSAAFYEECSDFILRHTSEILSEFAHFQLWWRWIFLFSGKAKKNRFRAIWALNVLQIAKTPQKFPWAVIVSVAYLTSKMSEIIIFLRFSKNQLSALIIFRNGQIPAEVRSCGPFWNLSAHSRFSKN